MNTYNLQNWIVQGNTPLIVTCCCMLLVSDGKRQMLFWDLQCYLNKVSAEIILVDRSVQFHNVWNFLKNVIKLFNKGDCCVLTDCVLRNCWVMMPTSKMLSWNFKTELELLLPKISKNGERETKDLAELFINFIMCCFKKNKSLWPNT